MTGLPSKDVARRWFLRECGVGLGAIALADLMATSSPALATEPSAADLPATDPLGTDPLRTDPLRTDPLGTKSPHFPGRAKNVIYLFMAGAPSHLEMFDYKPQLAKYDGTLPPADLLSGYRAAFINPNSKLLGPKFNFSRHGQCGAEISELLPQTAKVVDDLAIIKSMTTDAFNHAPAQIMMNTGSPLFGKPSLGAWTLYGLGSETRDLPGFVVFSSGTKGPSGGSSNWGSGYLPTVYQGVQLRSVGDPVLYLSNPAGIDNAVQRDTLDAINQLNRKRLAVTGDPEIATRINSFEMAYRMQASAPDVMDLSSEPQHVLDLYGVEPGESSFAKNCLLARRLVERGTRFVQLFHEAWDQHGNLTKDIQKNCKATDQGCAALIQDLKQRGLLEDTLVIWGGEFGRTPMVQGGGNDGRDHHPKAFTMWMAGGGVAPGITLGETDEFGFNTILDQVHVRDLHATILHLLGFDHHRLSVKFQGLDQRLTGVETAHVVDKLLA